MKKAKSLLQAVYKNSDSLIDEVKEFIESGANLNVITSHGESALRVASNNGRFDVIKLLLDAGADKEQLSWSNSFYEVAFGTVASLVESINKYNDLEHTDRWDRTPWLMSIQVGDIEKTSELIKLGANKMATGRCGKQPLEYAIQHNNLEMLEWLIEQGLDIEATNDFEDTPLIVAAELGMTDCVKYLINKGADIFKENHIPQRAIQVAPSLDIVRLLVDEGDDINDICELAHALLIGTKVNGTPKASQQDYVVGKNRRFGETNPEKTVNNFWLEMIRSGVSAYRARSTYNDCGSGGEPVWSYERFGRSTTILPNGTIIEIAGEHEDHYDPDFCIYNDVTVFNPGGEINIFSYPETVFPPTDFHTATLIGDYIYIIGSLGYMEKRVSGYTPVYKLSILSMEIEKVETAGDMPGWISNHKALLVDNSKIVLSGGDIYSYDGSEYKYEENNSKYQLCTKDNVWTRL